MRREDLELGGMYQGPEDECYEVRDLHPGWKIDAEGEWVPDNSTRTRHTGGVRSSYKVNLLIKAVIHKDGVQTRTVVDPRALKGPWEHYVNQQEVTGRHQMAARVATKNLVGVLRQHPAYSVRPVADYSVSRTGSTVTMPLDDLVLLMELAQPAVRPAEVKPVPQIDWLSP